MTEMETDHHESAKQETDHHESAKQLILKAAEDSGLLKEVAELLWFSSKHGGAISTMGVCAPCELLKQLTDAFDDHTCMAGLVGEFVFSPGVEGLCTFPSSAEAHEVEAFIG